MTKLHRALDRWSKLSDRYSGIVVAGHIWITALMILSGVDLLEPLAFTWFWAPVAVSMLSPDRFFGYEFGERFGWFIEKHFRVIFFINWLVTVVVVPCFIWRHLRWLDEMVFHKLRQGVGELLHLGGQTGLVLLVATVLSTIFVYTDWRYRVKWPVNRRR